MNAMVRSSEVSGYFKQVNSATVFYSFPHDIETALIKGMNVICTLAEIGQLSINNECNNNDATLNAAANECAPAQSRKRGKMQKKKQRGLKSVWNHPTILLQHASAEILTKVGKIIMQITIDTMF